MSAKENAARMVMYHENRRLGRCDRCFGPSRPNRAMCASCAVRHKRVCDETRWKGMGVLFTYDIYDRMFKDQGGVCAICKESDGVRLHMDHDHKTLVIRGLLCGKCNRGIGMFNDCPELMIYAAEYVAVTRAKGTPDAGAAVTGPNRLWEGDVAQNV